MPQPHPIVTRTGQTHDEAGPLLWLALHFDPAAMQIHDAMHGGEA
jgi:hypothetical protein